jgi:hypothetical protein
MESSSSFSLATIRKKVSVEPAGYAVSRNADIDISEYELWQHGEDMP